MEEYTLSSKMGALQFVRMGVKNTRLLRQRLEQASQFKARIKDAGSAPRPVIAFPTFRAIIPDPDHFFASLCFGISPFQPEITALQTLDLDLYTVRLDNILLTPNKKQASVEITASEEDIEPSQGFRFVKKKKAFGAAYLWSKEDAMALLLRLQEFGLGLDRGDLREAVEETSNTSPYDKKGVQALMAAAFGMAVTKCVAHMQERGGNEPGNKQEGDASRFRPASRWRMA